LLNTGEPTYPYQARRNDYRLNSFPNFKAIFGQQEFMSPKQTEQSMERNDNPGDGSNPQNCIPVLMTLATTASIGKLLKDQITERQVMPTIQKMIRLINQKFGTNCLTQKR